MLRPERGEGERPHNILKKGPLLFAVALFSATPICMAEVAMAQTTSSFVKTNSLQPYGHSTGLLQTQPASKTQKLIESLPKTSQGLLTRPFTSLPSQEQIDSLESILSDYQEQVQQLTQQLSELPTNNAELTAALQLAQSRVNILQTSIQELKDTLTAYEAHKDTLKAATDSYNNALLTQQTVQSQYDQLVATNSTNQEAAQQARTALTTAESNLTTAQATLNTALNRFTQATNTKQNVETLANQTQATLDASLGNYTEASATFQQASNELAVAQEDYNIALETFNEVDSNLLNKFIILNQKKSLYESALQTFNEADASLTQQTSLLASAQAEHDAASENLTTALNNLDVASGELSTANANLAEAETNLFDAQVTLNDAQQAVSTTSSQLTIATSNRAIAAAELSTAYDTKTTAQQNLIQASTNLNNAQNAYDTELIPDPDWTAPTQQVAHTRLVPRTETVTTTTLVPRTVTTLQEQVIPNLLPNPTLTSTEGWSGVYAGWQDSQPGMFNGEIVFSYQNQTVSQGLYSGPFENATLTLSADWFSDWTADSYSMTVTAEDINRNPVGTATYTNTRTAHDWINRSVTLQATGPVSYITVSFSGIDHGFWLGNYGPHMKNPALQVSYGQYVTETIYEEVTTSEEVTTMVEETYYTTEVIQPQQGLTVKVYHNLPTANPERSDTAYTLCKTTTLTSINHNWGGGDILGCGGDRVMIHYTGYITPTQNVTYLRGLADDGFYLDINGVNAINNWTLKGCGGNWNPVNLQAGQSYAIDAWFFEWGGGACSILNYQTTNGQQGVVPEAWYSNGASAPLIKDPAKLVLLNQAQSAYNDQLAIYNAATASYNNESVEDQQAAAALTTAQNNYAAAVSAEQTTYNNLLSAQTAYDNASSQLSTKEDAASEAITNLIPAQAVYTARNSELLVATSNRDSAQTAYNLALADLNVKTQERDDAQATYNEASLNHQGPAQDLENAAATLDTKQAAYDAADTEVDSTFAALQAADEAHSQNQIALTSATKELETASSEYASATSDVAAKQTIKDDAVAVLAVAENVALTSQQEVEEVSIKLEAAKATTAQLYKVQTKAQSEVEATVEKISTVSTKVETAKSEVSTELPTLKKKVTAEVEKQAKPEEGSKEIPVVLTAENLLTVDLDKVDPTELTEEQAEQLVEAALETFQTAEAGSPEYEQALDALYLAAEQDDIELPEELAAIPGLAGAVEVLNFLGNAGADMSPQVREQSEKIVVTAVVAAGVAVQSAAAAATSAAASASAPSGGGSRRVGK